MKKLIILSLIFTLLLSLAAPALAAAAPFPDVYDETTRFETDVLRLLGVLSGDERGYFNPQNHLTRAEFCKMAVVIMGKGADEPLYRNRTIFSDVRGSHWARGYINIAVSENVRIIQGYGDGSFRPDEKITFAQAVTILLRILEYTDLDAGMLWPQGYIALARSTGLSEGLGDIAAEKPITRAQAAKLFCNMLKAKTKSGAAYPSKLGTTVMDVIQAVDVIAPDGSRGVKTSAGSFYKIKNEVPESLIGKKGTLIVDSNSYLLGFVPASQSFQTFTVASVQKGSITDLSGRRYDIPSTAKAYDSSGSGTYAEFWRRITPGMQVTLYYDQKGTVEEVYIKTSSSDSAVVAKNPVVGNPFYSLLGGETQYTIIKNGTPATLEDIRQYDVATYDKAARILRISDFRLTGCYERAEPNQESPTKIWVMGMEFDVLPSAVSDVSSFRVGQTVTFLFTDDNKVAGAVSPGTVQGTAVGVVLQASSSNAEVELLNGIRVKGKPGLSDFEASSYIGALVTVSSYMPGQITLAPLTSSLTYFDLDLVNRTMGGTPFSAGIKIYERVGNSGLVQISLDDLTQKSIKASKILYAARDYSGKVGTLILNDVTGDRYIYGILIEGKVDVPDVGVGGTQSYNRTVAVYNHSGTSTPLITGMPFTNGVKGGIVADASGQKTAGIVELIEVRNVSRNAFRTEGDGKVILSLPDMEIPVASNVVCYNRTTGFWFSSLDEARAYSDTLTIYYDRRPEEGGKVRFVEVG